ncbi:hypothetical protein I2I11_20705 [Pontibacter sp. 172403-2]|uniref:hypothetical protein n=1 Tax=Pontibacter rufus TaxID=2791028 RepID=UPI0018AF7222|nr:hypothetical protein [Pontibacter sp. 172403-2]MBF9255731.1 hypothetical protein [Pontibacter sp. 172403-2]
MATLTIPSQLDSEVLERLLKDLAHSPEGINLKVPLKLSYRGFGILPNLLQVIFTWIRRNKGGKLVIPLESNNTLQAKDFTYSYFGYVLLSSAWKECEIVNENGEQLKASLKKYTQEMHRKIDFLEGLPNEAILIPCFDHYSNEKGLPHWFYTSTFNFAEVPSALDNTVYRILESLGKIYTNRFTRNNSPILEDLQSILWELMKNTDEHATMDYLNKVDLTPNVRGAFLKIQRSSKGKFIEGAKSHVGLVNFYESSLEDDNNFILEISVFDSGPGLAKRFLGKDWTNSLSIQNEVAAIKKCLIKGASSVTTLKGINKGFGLDNVLQLLSKKRGFLKIRTGRTCLYRDLISTPYTEASSFESVELKDWESSSANAFTEMWHSEGTVITMAYPLNTV